MADDPDPDLDALAADYVLGTLDAGERRAFRRRMMHEPAAAEAVRAWERRLSPVDQAYDPVDPPTALWPRIEAATTGGRAANDNGARRWRLAAIAAALLAVVTSTLAVRQAVVPLAPPGSTAVATLTAGGATPAVVVSYDPAGHALKIMAVQVDAHPGRSLQVWMIAGKAAPRPMAIMPATGIAALRGVALDPARATVFAISIEPIGGSPTGAPTGPVVYSGKLIRLPRA